MLPMLNGFLDSRKNISGKSLLRGKFYCIEKFKEPRFFFEFICLNNVIHMSIIKWIKALYYFIPFNNLFYFAVKSYHNFF